MVMEMTSTPKTRVSFIYYLFILIIYFFALINGNYKGQENES